MEVNELMIRDWVKMKLRCHKEWYIDQVGCLSPLMDYEPIPLSAEILEKNDFPRDMVMIEFDDRYEDADDRLTYDVHISGGAIGINGFMWYVHELQHALRLCGLTELADNLKVE